MKLVMGPFRYASVEFILKQEAPGFLQSPEFQLHNDTMTGLPGVTAAAYARYLCRIARDGAELSALAGHLAILSRIADWADTDVDILLKDEVFEEFFHEHVDVDLLPPLMSGRLRELYDDWLPEYLASHS